MVKTPPELFTLPNILFSVVCTVVVEYDGQPLSATITWTRITISPPMNMSTENVLAVQEFSGEDASMLNLSSSANSKFCFSLYPGYSSCDISSKWGYQSVLHSMENDIANSMVFYRCNIQTVGSYSSSDTNVFILSSMLC